MRFFASNGSAGLDGYDIHEVGDNGVGQRVLTIYAPSSEGQAGKDRARAAVALVVDDLNAKAEAEARAIKGLYGEPDHFVYPQTESV